MIRGQWWWSAALLVGGGRLEEGWRVWNFKWFQVEHCGQPQLLHIKTSAGHTFACNLPSYQHGLWTFLNLNCLNFNNDVFRKYVEILWFGM